MMFGVNALTENDVSLMVIVEVSATSVLFSLNREFVNLALWVSNDDKARS